MENQKPFLLRSSQRSDYSFSCLRKMDVQAVAKLLWDYIGPRGSAPYRSFCSEALRRLPEYRSAEVEEVFTGHSKESQYQIINFCLRELVEHGLVEVYNDGRVGQSRKKSKRLEIYFVLPPEAALLFDD